MSDCWNEWIFLKQELCWKLYKGNIKNAHAVKIELSFLTHPSASSTSMRFIKQRRYVFVFNIVYGTIIITHVLTYSDQNKKKKSRLWWQTLKFSNSFLWYNEQINIVPKIHHFSKWICDISVKKILKVFTMSWKKIKTHHGKILIVHNTQMINILRKHSS